MMSTAATAEELRAILDHLDDLVIERIVATGATLDEVGEAMDDRDVQRPPSSGRVVEVRRILAEAAAADASRAPILR